MEIKDGNLSRDVWAHGDVSNGNPTAVEAAWVKQVDLLRESS